jgi:hypothetical protein
MSFLYPRIIAITRPNTLSGIGAQPYQGLEPAQETSVVLAISASIQEIKETRQSVAGLPGDVARGTLWNIFFKASKGLVKDRDVITDDLGIRYQVTGAYWNSLGYKCLCERLQT